MFSKVKIYRKVFNFMELTARPASNSFLTPKYSIRDFRSKKKKGRFHFHSPKTETDKTKATSIRNDPLQK